MHRCWTPLLTFLLVACSINQAGYLPPPVHPPIYELGENRVYCVRCHGHGTEKIDFERFDHTPFFTEGHRVVAGQSEQVCAMCHQPAFCNVCHATPSSELKPSELYPTENSRRFQHRGDYLSRHGIEARIDPGSCFRCHGNPRSAQSCRRCHG